MTVSPQDISEFSYPASHVRMAREISFGEAVAYVKEVQDVHGVAPEDLVKEELYRLPLEVFAELKKPNRFVTLVADKRDISFTQAFALMHEVKTRYGLGFREFAQKKLYAYKSEEALREALRRIIEREGLKIQQVCYETGWSVDEAESKMRVTKEKFPSIDFRKYASYGFFAKTDEEIAEKMKEWNEAAKENRHQVMEATGWSESRVRKHMIRYQVLYDVIPAYYICYRAWQLSDKEMDSYARQKLSERISNKYNVKADTELLSRKDYFNQYYSDFTRRKFWVNEKSSTFEEFEKFAEGLDEAFCKPLSSGGGLGTFKVNLDVDAEGRRRAYENLMSKSLVLVEESVKQHDQISEFYPHSVNTIRVVTIQDQDGVHIISAGIRFGANSITDNFSADGMVSDVDIESGRIVTPAVDKKGYSYEAHPYSGKKFVGFEIPHWDEALETAKKAMDVLPGVNYVGWDLAISPEYVSIIEGNSQPDLVLVQAPYAPMQVGKRYLFDPYLKK